MDIMMLDCARNEFLVSVILSYIDVDKSLLALMKWHVASSVRTNERMVLLR